MRFSLFLTTTALFGNALAYASWGDSKLASAAHGMLMKTIQKRAKGSSTVKGASSPGNDGSATPGLIGDLRTGITSQTGNDVAAILLSEQDPYSDVTGNRPADVSECETSTDACCVWYFISEMLTKEFLGDDGLCTDRARAAVRLGFHDAGTWSQSLANQGQDFGGADGSFFLFNEITRPENGGLEDIIELVGDIWMMFDITVADLIQYMAKHAVVTCPLGPRTRTFVGREDAVEQSPTKLLPDVHADADTLIALFDDKTISPHDLAALIGAHSTSKQFHQAVPAGTPQDTTPGVWDVSFYNETIQTGGPDGVFKFESDVVLSQDPRVSDEFLSFIDDQDHWNEDFARAYIRLSLLGVNNINSMTECTKTLPAARKSVPPQNNTSSSTSSTMSSTTSSTTTTTSSSVSLTSRSSSTDPSASSATIATTSSESYSTTSSDLTSSYMTSTDLSSTTGSSTPTATSTASDSSETDSSASSDPTSSDASSISSSTSDHSFGTESTYGASHTSTSALSTSSYEASSTYATHASSSSDPASSSLASIYSSSTSTSHSYYSSTSTYRGSSTSAASLSHYSSSTYSDSSTSAGGEATSDYSSSTRTTEPAPPSYSTPKVSYSKYPTGTGNEYPTLTTSYYSPTSHKHAGSYVGSSQTTVTKIITTSYIDINRTGLTTKVATYTTTHCSGAPSESGALPPGWTTAVTVCTNCGPYPTSMTLTKPMRHDMGDTYADHTHPVPSGIPGAGAIMANPAGSYVSHGADTGSGAHSVNVAAGETYPSGPPGSAPAPGYGQSAPSAGHTANVSAGASSSAANYKATTPPGSYVAGTGAAGPSIAAYPTGSAPVTAAGSIVRGGYGLSLPVAIVVLAISSGLV